MTSYTHNNSNKSNNNSNSINSSTISTILPSSNYDSSQVIDLNNNNEINKLSSPIHLNIRNRDYYFKNRHKKYQQQQQQQQQQYYHQQQPYSQQQQQQTYHNNSHPYQHSYSANTNLSISTSITSTNSGNNSSAGHIVSNNGNISTNNTSNISNSIGTSNNTSMNTDYSIYSKKNSASTTTSTTSTLNTNANVVATDEHEFKLPITSMNNNNIHHNHHHYHHNTKLDKSSSNDVNHNLNLNDNQQYIQQQQHPSHSHQQQQQQQQPNNVYVPPSILHPKIIHTTITQSPSPSIKNDVSPSIFSLPSSLASTLSHGLNTNIDTQSQPQSQSQSQTQYHTPKRYGQNRAIITEKCFRSPNVPAYETNHHISEVEKKFIHLQNEYELMKNEMKDKETENLLLKKETQSLTHEIGLLKSDYHYVQLILEQKNHEIHALKLQNEELKREVIFVDGKEMSLSGSKETKFRKLINQIEQKSHEITTLNKTINDFKTNQSNEIKQLEATILKLNKEIDQKDKEINSKDIEIQKLKQQIQGQLPSQFPKQSNHLHIQQSSISSDLGSFCKDLQLITPKKHAILLRKGKTFDDLETVTSSRMASQSINGSNSLEDSQTIKNTNNNNNNNGLLVNTQQIQDYSFSQMNQNTSMETDLKNESELKNKEIMELKSRLHEIEEYRVLQDNMIIKLNDEINELVNLVEKLRNKSYHNNDQQQQQQQIDKLHEQIDYYKKTIIKLEHQCDSLRKEFDGASNYCIRLQEDIKRLQHEKTIVHTLNLKGDIEGFPSFGSGYNSSSNDGGDTGGDIGNTCRDNILECAENNDDNKPNNNIKEDNEKDENKDGIDELEKRKLVLNEELKNLEEKIKEREAILNRMLDQKIISEPANPIQNQQQGQYHQQDLNLHEKYEKDQNEHQCHQQTDGDSKSKDKMPNEDTLYYKELYDKISDDNKALLHENELLRLEVVDLTERITHLQKEVDISKKDHLKHHELILQLNQDNQNLHGEIEKLELMYKTEVMKLQQANDDIKSKCDTLYMVYNKQKEDLIRMMNEINMKDAMIKDLYEENDKLKSNTLKLKNSVCSIIYNTNGGVGSNSELSVEEDSNNELIKKLKNLNEELSKMDQGFNNNTTTQYHSIASNRNRNLYNSIVISSTTNNNYPNCNTNTSNHNSSSNSNRSRSSNCSRNSNENNHHHHTSNPLTIATNFKCMNDLRQSYAITTTNKAKSPNNLKYSQALGDMTNVEYIRYNNTNVHNSLCIKNSIESKLNDTY